MSNNQFSYYFEGVRQTRTDDEYLRQLASNCDNHEDIVNGIKESKARFDNEQVVQNV